MFETRRRVRFTPGGGIPTPPGGSPAGPAAYSYGVPPAQAGGGRGQQPMFPLGQYPVKLPAVSLLGARNDLPSNSGAGGTTCAGASADVDPIFQFDTSGKLLRTFGAGMFVSPHKLSGRRIFAQPVRWPRGLSPVRRSDRRSHELAPAADPSDRAGANRSCYPARKRRWRHVLSTRER